MAANDPVLEQIATYAWPRSGIQAPQVRGGYTPTSRTGDMGKVETQYTASEQSERLAGEELGPAPVRLQLIQVGSMIIPRTSNVERLHDSRLQVKTPFRYMLQPATHGQMR